MLIGLASMTGVVALILAVVVVANGGGPSQPAKIASAGTTAPGDTTTSTVIGDVPTTVPVLPVDATTTAPAIASATTTTTTSPPAPVVSAAGAVLHPPTTTVTRAMGPGCATLAEPGWTADCGAAHAVGGDLVWMIETGPGGADLRASVWAHDSGPTWREVLTAAGPNGGRYDHMKARVADISGDGFDDIAFGFGVVGTQQLLQVDVVDGSKSVVAHRDLAHGAARVANGQLDGWSGRDTASGPQWVHEVIRYQSGAWRIVSSTVVTQSAVPPSQL
ncbi:MAG: hypothetical protein JWO37_1134 [Acidimicrobiales bacterium]|nr:hypothetical protein [Acidimicrobiales bacterium]